ncbi:MAG: hypothetical protein JSV51_08715 [Candidatus Bathyarchaeota archaeon]|nr:MAG: hypothetical protein JSV51_08715 [Candidatus Bathyarchaeota archaeon]
MNEHSLHSEIKKWYSLPGDRFETIVDGFIIDIVRGPLLIEIQTRNFSAIKKKLTCLVEKHRVRLVHPILEKKYLVLNSKSGKIIRRRKSPRKGKIADLFFELVSIPALIRENNFTLEVLMIEGEETRCNNGKGSWRRKGVSIRDKRLLHVVNSTLFKNEKDFTRFLPADIGWRFTNTELAKKGGISISLARKITYCLKKMNVIMVSGKTGKKFEFQRNF